MYNDFVVIGPLADPAGIGTAISVAQAMTAIRKAGAKFASRGDNSGTNRAERRLWETSGEAPDSNTDSWYLETGMGMGATLNLTVQAGAYNQRSRHLACLREQGESRYPVRRRYRTVQSVRRDSRVARALPVNQVSGRGGVPGLACVRRWPDGHCRLPERRKPAFLPERRITAPALFSEQCHETVMMDAQTGMQ